MKKVTRAQLQAARRAHWKARDRSDQMRMKYETQTLAPSAKKMVGKCFSFTNSYGGGDRWTGYARIISTIQLFEIERDCNGRIKAETRVISLFLDDGVGLPSLYTEISEAEYAAAVRPLLDEINGLAGVK